MSKALTRHDETGLNHSCFYGNSCSFKGAVEDYHPAIKKTLQEWQRSRIFFGTILAYISIPVVSKEDYENENKESYHNG